MTALFAVGAPDTVGRLIVPARPPGALQNGAVDVVTGSDGDQR